MLRPHFLATFDTDLRFSSLRIKSKSFSCRVKSNRVPFCTRLISTSVDARKLTMKSNLSSFADKGQLEKKIPTKHTKRNWKQHFDFIYKNFIDIASSKEVKPTNKGFVEFIGITIGKFGKWSKGQWPSAEDLEALHKKMGFSYSWLVTGTGDPFDEDASAHADTSDTAALHARIAELEHEIGRLREALLSAHEANTEMGKANARLSERLAKRDEEAEGGLAQSRGDALGVPQAGRRSADCSSKN